MYNVVQVLSVEKHQKNAHPIMKVVDIYTREKQGPCVICKAPHNLCSEKTGQKGRVVH